MNQRIPAILCGATAGLLLAILGIASGMLMGLAYVRFIQWYVP